MTLKVNTILLVILSRRGTPGFLLQQKNTFGNVLSLKRGGKKEKFYIKKWVLKTYFIIY